MFFPLDIDISQSDAVIAACVIIVICGIVWLCKAI